MGHRWTLWLLLLVAITAAHAQQPPLRDIRARLPQMSSTPLQTSDLISACAVVRDRLFILNFTETARQGVHAYVVMSNVMLPLNQSQYTYLYMRDTPVADAFDEAGVPTNKQHLKRYAKAMLAAHDASQANYKWLLYGDDDTLWLVRNVLDMLEGYDHNMPYWISDNDYTWDTIRCLPCHFQRPAGWNASERFLDVKGCPCSYGALCDINGDKCGVMGSYGGTGMIFSAGLMRALNRTRYEECLDVWLPRKLIVAGDQLMSYCLREQNFAITDPGPSQFGFGPAFSHHLKDQQMLADIAHCRGLMVILWTQRPEVLEGIASCQKRLGHVVSQHMTSIRTFEQEPELGRAYATLITEGVAGILRSMHPDARVWNQIRKQ